MKILNRFTGSLIRDTGNADLRGADLRGADLCDADLRDADLRDADLRDADLRDANLCGADLCGANLCGANLCDANLCGANLCDANLRGADLRDADLCGADLCDADLCGADLRDANLRGAENLDKTSIFDLAPLVPDLHKRVLAAVGDGSTLKMDAWHTCKTTHCRGGHAIALAGEAGRIFEGFTSSDTAARLIYLKSTGMIPNFYANDQDALADIKKCATTG